MLGRGGVCKGRVDHQPIEIEPLICGRSFRCVTPSVPPCISTSHCLIEHAISARQDLINLYSVASSPLGALYVLFQAVAFNVYVIAAPGLALMFLRVMLTLQSPHSVF